MLLIVCVAAISWAGRMVWDNYHPAQVVVRGLRSADASEREAAVREVSELGAGASGEAIRAVLPVLADPDAGVRTAGAEALGVVGSYAALDIFSVGVLVGLWAPRRRT
jgi:hypothetical protein